MWKTGLVKEESGSCLGSGYVAVTLVLSRRQGTTHRSRLAALHIGGSGRASSVHQVTGRHSRKGWGSLNGVAEYARILVDCVQSRQRNRACYGNDVLV